VCRGRSTRANRVFFASAGGGAPRPGRTTGQDEAVEADPRASRCAHRRGHSAHAPDQQKAEGRDDCAGRPADRPATTRQHVADGECDRDDDKRPSASAVGDQTAEDLGIEQRGGEQDRGEDQPSRPAHPFAAQVRRPAEQRTDDRPGEQDEHERQPGGLRAASSQLRHPATEPGRPGEPAETTDDEVPRGGAGAAGPDAHRDLPGSARTRLAPRAANMSIHTPIAIRPATSGPNTAGNITTNT
jgi:hypothetical protein